jgi:hypothetical protein
MLHLATSSPPPRLGSPGPRRLQPPTVPQGARALSIDNAKGSASLQNITDVRSEVKGGSYHTSGRHLLPLRRAQESILTNWSAANLSLSASSSNRRSWVSTIPSTDERAYVVAIRAELDPIRQRAINAGAVRRTQERLAPLFRIIREAMPSEPESPQSGRRSAAVEQRTCEPSSPTSTQLALCGKASRSSERPTSYGPSTAPTLLMKKSAGGTSLSGFDIWSVKHDCAYIILQLAL